MAINNGNNNINNISLNINTSNVIYEDEKFIFYKNLNDYFIKLKENVEPLNYILYKKEKCSNNNIIEKEGIVLNETNITLNLDGEFTLVVDGHSFFIKKYEFLQQTIIDSIEKVLCNCDCCNDCEDFNVSCDLINLNNKITLYKNLTYPFGYNYFTTLFEYSSCILNEKVYCNLNKEILIGKEECDINTYKDILSLDYLAMYFYELNQKDTQEWEDLVNKKFNYKVIKECINLDINKIKQIIENSMGTFTININAYENKPPDVVGDYSTNIDNRATLTLTRAMFTTATTPVYHDPEGDAADAIKILSLPADGVLKFNGNAVTVNQEILLSDVDNNLLVYEAPNQDAADTVNFDFAVRDTGSGQFSS